MKTRKMSLFLAALLAGTAASSCGSGETQQSDSTTESDGQVTETEKVDYLETLPDKNYDGYEFRIIAQSYEQRPNLPLSEEENGEVLNDGIIKRNRMVEDKLGVTIVNYPYENRDEVASKVRSTVLADEDAYDLIITSVNIGINTLTADGCLFDLQDMEYLDLSQEWWCQSINEDFAVNGHLYFTTGPLSPFFYYMPAAVAYNKTLTDEYKISGLEQLVLGGKWTFDRLKEFTLGKSIDLNGDSKLDENDKYPIAGAAVDGYFLAGFGEKMIIRNNGEFRLNMASESFVAKMEALSNYFADNTTFFNDSNTATFLTMFETDRAMFIQTSMNNLITGYNAVPSAREMNSDYGILPLPKYDESQESYYTIGQPAGPSGIAVPATCRDAERTSLVMEVMAYYSNDLIRNAAYDCIVKGKAARLEGTEEMLDIVYSNVFFDVNYVFNFGGTKDTVQFALRDGTDNYMSNYTAQLSSAQTALDDYVDMLNALEK